MSRIVILAALLLATATSTAAAGTVRGRVVDETTQLPIVGARLTVVSSFAGFTSLGPVVDTDTDGQYLFTFSPPPGQTQVLGITAEAAGYAARQHDGRPCNRPGSCAAGGSALVIGADTDLVIGFALQPGARLRGRVVDLVTGDPIVNAAVGVQAAGPGGFDQQGGVQSDASGEFVIDRLHAGSYQLTARAPYWIAASGTLPYLDYAWPDLHCDGVQQSCLTLNPTPVVLAAGADASGFDIRLRHGSAVRARMRSLGNGAAISQVTTVAAPAAMSAASALSSSDGYAYVGPLLPGQVALALEPSADTAYPAIVHPDRPCTATPCDLSRAPTIAVPEVTLVTAADVDVLPLRTIAGRVTDANGFALSGIRVSAGDVRFGIFGPSGFAREATTLTGADGSYHLEGFYNDRQIVRTQAAAGHWIDIAWPDTVCNGANLFCENENAAYPELDMAATPHATGIDLVLRPATTLQGKVVGTDGAAKPSWQVALIPASAGRPSQPVTTDGEGRFHFDGLTSEMYFIWASASPPRTGNSGTLYPDVSCLLDSSLPTTSCDLPAATAVTPAGSGIEGLVITVPPPDAIFAAPFE